MQQAMKAEALRTQAHFTSERDEAEGSKQPLEVIKSGLADAQQAFTFPPRQFDNTVVTRSFFANALNCYATHSRRRSDGYWLALCRPAGLAPERALGR